MTQAAISDRLRVVRCGLAGETYALDMTCVRSIQRADRLRPHPERADAVGKLPGLNGDVPVFELAELLGRPQQLRASGVNQIVVLNDGQRTWGLLVERVSPVTRVPAESVHPLPALVGGAAALLFRGVLRLETELLPLLAPARLHPDSSPWEEDAPTFVSRRGRYKAGGAYGLQRGTKHGLGKIVLFATTDPQPRERPLVFGVSLARVLEILDLPRLVPVPGSAKYVLGLAAWRGLPIPVVDLARRLGLPPSANGQRSRLLVVHTAEGAEPVGIVVRPTVRILRLPLPQRPSVRQIQLDPPMTRAVVELKRETLVIPDLRGLGGVEGLSAGIGPLAATQSFGSAAAGA
jgi:purine-binding chemotaxis protein CheW